MEKGCYSAGPLSIVLILYIYRERGGTTLEHAAGRRARTPRFRKSEDINGCVWNPPNIKVAQQQREGAKSLFPPDSRGLCVWWMNSCRFYSARQGACRFHTKTAVNNYRSRIQKKWHPFQDPFFFAVKCFRLKWWKKQRKKTRNSLTCLDTQDILQCSDFSQDKRTKIKYKWGKLDWRAQRGQSWCCPLSLVLCVVPFSLNFAQSFTDRPSETPAPTLMRFETDISKEPFIIQWAPAQRHSRRMDFRFLPSHAMDDKQRIVVPAFISTHPVFVWLTELTIQNAKQ